MDLKRFLTDDEAVSPVVGVTMMIAIAVVLAAVVGMLVLNMGQGQSQTPTASFEFNTAGNSDVVAIHDSGDEISTSQLKVTVDGANKNGSATYSDGATMSAGDKITIDSTAVSTGDVVRIVWNAPDSDKTSIIAKFKVE